MIGIICAEPEEMNEIMIFMKNIKKEKVNSFEFTLGVLFGINCIIVMSGVGKVHSAICTQTLILKYHPDMILNVGVAGGIEENLNIGDIVIAQNVIQHDFDVSVFPGRKKGQISGFDAVEIPCTKWINDKILYSAKNIMDLNIHTGNILTGDQFINSSQKLYELKNEFNGMACEMEAGSIGQVCYLNNVDFGIIRSISDLANENSTGDFKSFIKKSSQNSALILSEFIKSYRG